MNEIELLPEEVVVNICSEMDNPTLSRFIRTSTKYNRICGEILEKRRIGMLITLQVASAEVAKRSYKNKDRVVVELTSFVPGTHFYLATSPKVGFEVGLIEVSDKPLFFSDTAVGSKSFTLIGPPDEVPVAFVYLLSNNLIDGTIINHDVQDPFILSLDAIMEADVYA